MKIERKIKRKGESGSETQTETAHFFGSEKKNRREGIFFEICSLHAGFRIVLINKLDCSEERQWYRSERCRAGFRFGEMGKY